MKSRILIVEDEGVVAKGLEKKLQGFGYDVVADVRTGEEAVEKAGEARPDIVLMDIVLAGEMDGIEAAERIRSQYDIPVVYLTAFADRRIISRAKLTEPYGYLVKPLSERELRSTIEMALYKAHMEKRLKEGEKRFRELAELLPQTVYEVDTEGTFTFINRSGLDACGYTYEHVQQGLKLTDTVAPEDRPKLRQFIKRVLDGEQVAEQEFTALHRDGTTFPVVQFVTPMMRDDEVTGIRGVSVDVTVLKQTQEALEAARAQLEERVRLRTSQLQAAYVDLEKAETKYRTLVERIPAITYIADIDRDSTVIYVSPQVETFLGLSPSSGAIDSRFWIEHLHPEDRDRVLSERARCLGAGELFVSEYRMLTANGDIIWFRDEATIVRDEHGQPAFFQGIMVDSTAEKRAEQELRRSEERFRAIFESASDCIFVKDASLRYTHVNPAMETLFNLPAESLIGQTDEVLFGREVSARSREVESRVIAGDTTEEEHSKTVNGVPMTFHVTKVPLRDHIGNVVGLCGISRDVTERKRALSMVPATDEQYPSDAMKATLAEALRAAETDSMILLTGESGSGKDYLARYIHDHSRRSSGPFFAVNCAAVAPEIAESELFGHEPGSFTGAKGSKRGLLELAEGGTLLLNEIGELSVRLQAKLLTFLDTKSFTKVGGERMVTVNARLIAATNRNLEQEVKEGRFRNDLFYRLNVLAIRIPPLRERKDDLPVMVRQMLTRLVAEMQLPYVPEIDEKSLEKFRRYRWPGNARELRNVLERALILSRGGPLEWEFPEITDEDHNEAQGTMVLPYGSTLNDVVARFKRGLVIQALRNNRGNRSRAAKDLGISRFSIIHYIKSLGIEEDDI